MPRTNDAVAFGNIAAVEGAVKNVGEQQGITIGAARKNAIIDASGHRRLRVGRRKEKLICRARGRIGGVGVKVFQARASFL